MFNDINGNTYKVSTDPNLGAWRVYTDKNKGGTFDTGETGLSGWRVFIDTDKDGVWDSTETSVLTDSCGTWSFKNKAAGAYSVRGVRQAKYTLRAPMATAFSVTLASGGTKSGLLFAEKPT